MRRLVVVVAVASLLVASAAYAFSRPTAEARALAAVRRAPDRAAQAGPFAVRLTMSLRRSDGTTVSTTTSGRVDPKKRRSSFDLFPVLGDRALQLVSEGRVLFLSIPADRQAAFDGRRWVRVDAGTPQAAFGAGLGPLPDPMTLIDSLAGASSPLTTERPEHGVRRVRLVIDVALASKHLATAQSQALRALERPRLAAEVLLDERGRLRRAIVTVPAASAGTITADLRVDSYGEPILIGIPPRDATHAVRTADEALAAVSG